jgi:hypothetical protein
MFANQELTHHLVTCKFLTILTRGFKFDIILQLPGGEMTADKIQSVIKVYRRKLTQYNIKPQDYPPEVPLAVRTRGLQHCMGMLDKMEEFIRQGRIDKSFRWLGFVQGVLWSYGIYTLEELKNHSRTRKS